MVVYTTQETLAYGLTPEGNDIADRGSHEALVWSVLPMKGQGPALPVKELKTKVGDETAKIGQGRAFKNGWVGKEGDGLVRLVRRFRRDSILADSGKVEAIDDSTRAELTEVRTTGTLEAGDKALAELKKRKLVIQKWVSAPSVTFGCLIGRSESCYGSQFRRVPISARYWTSLRLT